MHGWPELNLTTGPVEMSERTLREGARPILYHYDPAFLELFEHTCALLQQVYGTRHDVVIMQGEALLGLEAAAASLIAPGTRVLNLVSGVYGRGYETYLRRYGAEIESLTVPYNRAIDPDDVRRALERHPEITVLSMVQVETPSGTVNPVAPICSIAREFGVLTIVDAVAGLGAGPFSPEDWGVDLAVAGPQKCLGGPPGLALLAVSPRAWDMMERHPQPLRGSYLSILDWKDTWLGRRRFPHAPSVGLIYGLESALTQVLEVGLDRWAARHVAIGAACRAGVRALSLELWPASESIASAAVTAVTMPRGIGERQLQEQLRGRYGVMIPNSEGDLAGKLFRIGHMGPVARPAALALGLAALGHTLADLGHPADPAAGVAAALAALSWPS